MDFETNLFADHKLPFAAYAEPDGYASLSHLKVLNRAKHWAKLPLTCEVVDAMFASLPQTYKWGKQIIRTVDRKCKPDWVTESVGKWYKARKAPKATKARERPGQRLTANVLRRVLARPDALAHGRTDSHVEEIEYGQYGKGPFYTTQVNCLLLDVDMDEAWAKHDALAVRQEMHREHFAAQAFGLPYRAFRTGGRGHQCVLPLPTPIDRSAASWLLTAYRRVLSASLMSACEEGKLWNIGGAEAPPMGVHLDKSNLDSIVRLVGGRHAGTNRLALWINPATADLYDMEMQVALMKTGYVHPGDDSFWPETFADAAEEISTFLESRFFVRHLCPRLRDREMLLGAVATALPDNALVCRYLTALHGFDNHVTTPLSLKKPKALATSGMAGTGLRAWAQEILSTAIKSGTSWDYFSEGGQRAITAAKVLYGEQAQAQLVAKIDRESGSALKAGERKGTVADLFTTHEMLWYNADKPRRGVEGVLSDDAADLIPSVLDAVHAKRRVQERNRVDIEHLIHVLLLAFDGAEDGYIEASLDTLTAAIRTKWPGGGDAKPVDRSTVGRHLLRLKEGESVCGFSLVQEIIQDQSGQVKATRYRPGTDLRTTAWGATLPANTLQDAPSPANGPLLMRVRSAQGPAIRDFTAARRGRKPKAIAAYERLRRQQ